jgi:hypothetical protein
VLGITRITGGEEVLMIPKYPAITVRLTGQDGNAYSILGRVLRALREAGVPEAERQAVQAEATSGDYGHLLQTVMQTVHWE